MSGDSGGIILGLVAAPVILAGAAAAGIAYGAVKVGGFLAKSLFDYAKQKHAEKVLAVNNCSAELDTLYQNIQIILRQQADACHGISLETQKKLEAAAAGMQNMADDIIAQDVAALNEQIAASHSAITSAMAEHTAQVRKEILDEGRRQLQECAKALDDVSKTKTALVNWKDKTAAAQAQQKALAYDSLRDALSSVNMMRGLTASARDMGFQEQYNALKEAYDKAKKNFDDGMYDAAFSGSRTVIRQVALAVAAQQTNQMERDFAAIQLQARMEGLITEMANRRYIEYTADQVTPGEVYEEDLDEFSQGQYSKMQALLARKMSDMRNPATLYDVQRMTHEFENVLEPQAIQVMQVAQQVLLGYHEKLKVLDVIKEFMESQNYEMEWAAPVGDDMSQKLVVKFTTKAGASISVTLDNRAETGDIAKMALDVLTFYRDGNEVSEKEKQELRDKMNHALKDAGITGAVQCRGNVNKPSSQTSMNTEDGVLNEQVRRIL